MEDVGAGAGVDDEQPPTAIVKIAPSNGAREILMPSVSHGVQLKAFVSSAEARGQARIEGLVYQGAQTDMTARLSDGQRVLLSVREPAPAQLAAGQTVRMHLPPDAFMVLMGEPSSPR